MIEKIGVQDSCSLSLKRGDQVLDTRTSQTNTNDSILAMLDNIIKELRCKSGT